MMNDVNTHSTAAFQSLNDINWTTQQPNETMKMQFSFPAKLYNLLETSDKSIIDWLPNGKAFRVYDLDKFVEVIMPTYFKRKILYNFEYTYVTHVYLFISHQCFLFRI